MKWVNLESKINFINANATLSFLYYLKISSLDNAREQILSKFNALRRASLETCRFSEWLQS